MSAQYSSDVTLASADPALVLCWEEKVRQGEDCTLQLKHSKGRITTIFKSTRLLNKIPHPHSSDPILPQAEKEKKKKNKRKRGTPKSLEALLSYQKRLVEERGLPPSRLMQEQAAQASISPSQAGEEEDIHNFKCEICDYSTNSKHGLSVHIGHKHKEQQKPGGLEVGDCEALVIGNQEESNKKELVNSNSSSRPSKVLRCTLCRRTFHSNESFEEHKWCVYSSTKFTKCPLCVEDEPNCALLMYHIKEDHKKNYDWIVNDYN